MFYKETMFVINNKVIVQKKMFSFQYRVSRIIALVMKSMTATQWLSIGKYLRFWLNCWISNILCGHPVRIHDFSEV